MMSEEELDRRLDDLCDNLDSYVQLTVGSYRPDSPGRHFHIRTIKRLNSRQDLQTVFDDETFFDYLYATLVAWDMNSRGARLCGFSDFKKTICACRAEIMKLSTLSLGSLIQENAQSTDDYKKAVESLAEVLDRLRVSTKDSWLVANTKTLHHILPNLVPPIDRNFTLRFFFDSKAVRKGERCKHQFFDVFGHYLYIFDLAGEEIQDMVDMDGFNTSPTKVIDNAIIGWVRLNLPDKKEDADEQGTPTPY